MLSFPGISKSARCACVRHYVSNICTDYFIQNKLELLHTCSEKKSVVSEHPEIMDKWLQVANSNLTVYLTGGREHAEEDKVI